MPVNSHLKSAALGRANSHVRLRRTNAAPKLKCPHQVFLVARRRMVVNLTPGTNFPDEPEIINIPVLQERFRQVQAQGYLPEVLGEIFKQSQVEFNYSEDGEDDGEDDE